MTRSARRIFATAVAIYCGALCFPAVAEDFVVSQKGRVFEPGELHIKAGDTVHIENDDAVLHHVYIESPTMEFDSGEQPPGRRVSIKFPRAGVFDVQCDIHPKMLLKVTVE